ncbi:hypothetical protein Tco_1164161 [Tanacetum coccineum]
MLPMGIFPASRGTNFQSGGGGGGVDVCDSVVDVEVEVVLAGSVGELLFGVFNRVFGFDVDEVMESIVGVLSGVGGVLEIVVFGRGVCGIRAGCYSPKSEEESELGTELLLPFQKCDQAWHATSVEYLNVIEMLIGVVLRVGEQLVDCRVLHEGCYECCSHHGPEK